MIRSNELLYHQADSQNGMPLAIVRFTVYDNSGRLLAVEQVTYENDIDYFQSEVSAAIDCGVDICVLTPHDISSFKWLQKLVEA